MTRYALSIIQSMFWDVPNETTLINYDGDRKLNAEEIKFDHWYKQNT